jgi:two-component system chemotaxis response regulator CheB
VIAVVLSGARDDGTAGLRAVTRAGGAGIVQQPEDARYGSMPRSAIAGDSPEYVVPAGEIGALIRRLAAERRLRDRDPMQMEIGTFDWQSREAGGPDAGGFTCPECGGSIWDADDGRYVCRIGHGFAPESLLDGQAAAVENALSSAARALDEQAEMSRRLAGRLSARRSHQRLLADAEEAERNVDAVRQLLLSTRPRDG